MIGPVLVKKKPIVWFKKIYFSPFTTFNKSASESVFYRIFNFLSQKNLPKSNNAGIFVSSCVRTLRSNETMKLETRGLSNTVPSIPTVTLVNYPIIWCPSVPSRNEYAIDESVESFRETGSPRYSKAMR